MKRGFADCNTPSETDCPYGSIKDIFCPGRIVCLKVTRHSFFTLFKWFLFYFVDIVNYLFKHLCVLSHANV